MNGCDEVVRICAKSLEEAADAIGQSLRLVVVWREGIQMGGVYVNFERTDFELRVYTNYDDIVQSKMCDEFPSEAILMHAVSLTLSINQIISLLPRKFVDM